VPKGWSAEEMCLQGRPLRNPKRCPVCDEQIHAFTATCACRTMRQIDGRNFIVCRDCAIAYDLNRKAYSRLDERMSYTWSEVREIMERFALIKRRLYR
jgi:hypothetical protein